MNKICLIQNPIFHCSIGFCSSHSCDTSALYSCKVSVIQLTEMRVYLNILILKLFYFLIVVPNSWQCDIGVYNGKGQTFKIIEESPTNIPGCREVDTLNIQCLF